MRTRTGGAIVLSVGAVVVVALLLFYPFGGSAANGLTTYCEVTVSFSGTYNYLLLGSDITGLSLNPVEQGCSVLPTPTINLGNILSYGFTATVTSAPSGGSQSWSVTVPALTLTYAFSGSVVFSLAPGTYTFTWNSAVPLNYPYPIGSTTQASVQFTVH